MGNSDVCRLAKYLASPSTINHHGKTCCDEALGWLRCVDLSNCYHNGQWYPPTWLRDRFDWGPHLWPLYWCSIPEMEKLDCGALAAVSVYLHRMRGCVAIPVQLVLRYPVHVTEQWSARWEKQGVRAKWLAGDFAYHEVCGILKEERLFLWDPTENRWLDPPSFENEMFAITAIRIPRPREAGTCSGVRWKGVQVLFDVWQIITPNGAIDMTTHED